MFEKEAEDFLKKSLKVDDDEFDFFKNEASCKEEIKRLTDFIEPREKRIAELEKENAELKEKISVLLSCKNCSEKQRRMTNKELSRWLREKPTREFKYSSSISCSVHSTYTYNEDDGEEEVSKDLVIRENDGEWREPLVEVEE